MLVNREQAQVFEGRKVLLIYNEKMKTVLLDNERVNGRDE